MFVWPIRVYYEDTDAGGIVFYANYLKFFERARTEWLRAQGFGQNAMTAEFGSMFVVKSTSVDYFAPSRLDDELNVTVSVEKLGAASVYFLQEAKRTDPLSGEEVLLASGRICVVCVDAVGLKPTVMPAPILESSRAALVTPPVARPARNIAQTV